MHNRAGSPSTLAGTALWDDHWYTQHMVRPAPDFVLVQEDKDKSSAWMLPERAYHARMFKQMVCDPQHWQQVHTPLMDIVWQIRQLHAVALPPWRGKVAEWSRWKAYTVGYMYCTLKAKCHSRMSQQDVTARCHSRIAQQDVISVNHSSQSQRHRSTMSQQDVAMS